MNKKQELMETLSEEVDALYEHDDISETSTREKLVKALIIDHIDRNYNDDENPIIEGILNLTEPLNDIFTIFESYIDTDKVFEKVFKDFFIKGQSHRTFIEDCVYCDQFYDDEFCDDEEEIEEDDEGFIHDNEDC